ncbi:nuclease [Desulfosarcina alkanivorans]|uniref:Nuclease n=1 Tax=Desulfosarcina alkanivorans TaxID=571177 RepID=A0A5K7YQW8_9BACT|nr:thermonuclease family protein [Desulfosarcina alkanivorans]BBO67017.1 nuclease [Desulfosarcina alkanivorans]
MNDRTGPLKKAIPYGVCLIVLTLAVPVAFCETATWVTVRWVADGDTIILQDGRHVRYIGIDTPETDHGHQGAEPMGGEARCLNRRLVQGHQLRLVYDRDKKDRYGRTLAYVYRRDGRFVNAELLKRGLAHVLVRSPNTAKMKALIDAQRTAMEEGRGIWRFLDRSETPPRPCPANRRSMRFHAPECPMGKKISPKNRVWFSSPWEAFWSGFAPAKECIPFPPPQGP